MTDCVDLVTLCSVECAAEVLKLEVVWNIDNRTAVTSVTGEVTCAVVGVWLTIAAAGEFFVEVEQLRHTCSV